MSEKKTYWIGKLVIRFMKPFQVPEGFNADLHEAYDVDEILEDESTWRDLSFEDCTVEER